MSLIAPGTPAPSFRLRADDDRTFTESDLLGRTTLLVFYPFAFSPGCTDQLNLYDDLCAQFAERDLALYAVSCDSIWCQRAFKEDLEIEIEQLSDFEPKGETCRAFGVYHPGGFAQRALVLIGPDGVVRWSHQASAPSDVPDPGLIFDALAAH